MDASLTAPIQKHVVLVGAGNAHLQFVKLFGMRPVSGVAVTLVSEASVIPYSAMVPGHIAGDYTWAESTIDLVRLCRAVGVRFVAARASRIDVAGSRIGFASRPDMDYDALSLGLGSVPARPPGLTMNEASWPMRPLAGLLERLNHLERQLLQDARPFHLAVVGGGASGCELALAIAKRFGRFTGVRLTVFQSQPQLLPQFPAKASRILTDALRANGISVCLNARITGGNAKVLEVNGSQRVEVDAVLWATHAAPMELLQTSGLELNQDGFLIVGDTLQSLTARSIFGAGDCISFQSHPNLLKNGVYAVRQGRVLYDNVVSFLREQPLIRFRPQRRCLCLLNTADGSAVVTYGALTWRSRLVRGLKDRIDRAWIDKLTRFAAMPDSTSRQDESIQMRCGGCGSKVSSDVLSAVLRRLDVGDDPRISLGCAAGEDAAVYRMRPELVGTDQAQLLEVQTVDYFKAFVDDPYVFGRMAAVHAVSDLYAMNARPFAALAIATLPYARGPIQETMLRELLRGAVDSLRPLSVVLTGGHTTEGSELALGFAVTGYVEEGRLFQKSKLRPGDLLILTKPLGSGALLAAWMRGACPACWFDPLIQSMLVANDRAAEVFNRYGIRACTDVTGFGLAGHLLEMLDASQVSARLIAGQVRLYDGFADVVQCGVVSTLHQDNARVAGRVRGATTLPAWLFDPQTSGGLLAGVDPAAANDALRSLTDAGYTDATILGEVVASGASGEHSIFVE